MTTPKCFRCRPWTCSCEDPRVVGYENAAPPPAPRDEAVFQRLADAVDEITAKVARGEAITPLDAGKAHVALRAYQNHRAALRGTTDDKKGG